MLNKGLVNMIYYYLNYNNNYDLVLQITKEIGNFITKIYYDQVMYSNIASTFNLIDIINLINLKLQKIGLRSKFAIYYDQHRHINYDFQLLDDKYAFNQQKTRLLITLVCYLYYLPFINKIVKKYFRKTGIRPIKIFFEYSHNYNNSDIILSNINKLV